MAQRNSSAAELWLDTAERQGLWFNCSASGDVWRQFPEWPKEERDRAAAAWEVLVLEYEQNYEAIRDAIIRRRRAGGVPPVPERLAQGR